MSSSEYYRFHAKPRDDINHTSGVWINALLELDSTIQGNNMPSPYQLAVEAAHKIYGDIPLSITLWSVNLDDFEKTLKNSDYHVQASASYSDGSPTPRTNLGVYSALNKGDGVKVGVYMPDGMYTIKSLKEFWQGYSESIKRCTIITIKDQ